MRPRRVELHIEELVLHGFAAGDRHRIADAVREELERLLGERGVPPVLTQAGEVGAIDGGTISLAPRPGTGAAGVAVAGAIYGGLSR